MLTCRGSVTREISQPEGRNGRGAIPPGVESGADVVVTRNRTPLAVLQPLRRRRFVARAELAAAAGQLAPMDAAVFRADVDEALDQSPERGL